MDSRQSLASWAVTTTGEELLSLTALEMRAHGSTVAVVTASGRLSDKRERVTYRTLKGLGIIVVLLKMNTLVVHILDNSMSV